MEKNMNAKYRILFSLLYLVSLVLSACAGAATQTAAPAPMEAPTATEVKAEPTQPPAPTEPPAPAPTVAENTPTAAPQVENKLILATTTSTQDSGLLDYLLPGFEDEAGVKVDVIAVGTGQALQLGQDGNADVLLVHARAKEDDFMAAGDGVRREDVMYNDFVIVGPADDPAGIKGMTSAADAFTKLSETQSPFISRGDESGTHTKELSVWKRAGIEPAGDWYISAGQGMGEVLTMSDEQQAYTLSDRATYLARTKEGLGLDVLVEGDTALFNPYGVIAVNPEKNPAIQAELANQFIDWIISVPVQEKIGQYGVDDFGQSLFVPDSALWNASQESAAPAESALKLTGKVGDEKAWTEEDLQAMSMIDVESTNKQGEKEMYSGVLIADLLNQAVPPLIRRWAPNGFTRENIF
jgi:tungstate transport system substrate-binding protein